MIILYNPNQEKPFVVHYVNNTQVFRKEIIPGYIMGYRNLTGVTQIMNIQSLTGNNITILDPINGVYTNQGSFATGYTGFVAQSGLTLTTSLLTVSTGYTFVTSASTDNGLALNSATATTVGNTIKVGYSGASVSTLAWFNAISATAFSGFGISVVGQSSTVFINSGASITFSLSANTVSTNATKNLTLFVGDNVKRSDYPSASAFSATTAYNALNTLVTT